jgi:FdhD protein
VTNPTSITVVRAIKVRPGHRAELPEHLATEEPLEIRVGGPGQDPQPLAVTMRTPGHDFALAAGFVLTEGVTDRTGVAVVSYCDAPGGQTGPGSPAGSDLTGSRYNTVSVRLNHPWQPTRPARRFAATASCGVCGKSSIDEVEVVCAGVPQAAPVPAAVITLLPDRLRQAQRAFARTGGLHAAGLFGPSGELWWAREDVGRHNAVDKVIGETLLDPRAVQASGDLASALAGSVLMISGRVSFEIVQKAAVAGIGTIAAVSAPSSLAVDAANRLGVAVLAFVRGETFNIYSHPERVAFALDAQ